MKIPRKWEHIASECKKLGYPESTKIARKIDRVLDKLYRLKTTDDWKEDWKADAQRIMLILNRQDLITLAHRSKYCIGCYTSPCGTCKFGKKLGICLDDPGNTFGDFCDTLATEKKVKKK